MVALLVSIVTLMCVLQVLSQTDGPIDQGVCPVSWVQYKQKCYRALNRSDVTWNSSRALCSGEGARLVVIHSAAVNDLVNNISKRLPGVFIGLNDVEREGEFIWEDGMPVTYTNWGGEPNNVGGIERCVEMWRYGGWNDYPCDTTNPVVICERKIEQNKLCASNWMLGEEKCYKTFTQEATWVEAQDICRREAATLPVIRSIGEDTMIRNLAQKANVPLGLKDRSGKRIFTWEDGSNVTFSNWRVGPTGFAEQQDCVEMWPDGTWNDIYCDVTKHGCVCEKPAVTRPSVPGETDTTTPTSEGPAQGSSDGASDVALYAGIGGAVLGLILILVICILVWCIKRGKLSKSSTETGTKLRNVPLRSPTPAPAEPGTDTETSGVGFSGSFRNGEYETLDDYATTSPGYDNLRFNESPSNQAQTKSRNASYENDLNKANDPNPGDGAQSRQPQRDDSYIYMEPVMPTYVEIFE